MIAEMNLQALVDVGFVMLVTLVCLKSLFGNSDDGGGDRRRRLWHEQLTALEQTLKTLIEEAGAASRNLDRNLLQRKRELENLLKKIEGQPGTNSKTAASGSYSRNHQVSSFEEEDDDLPNESWKNPLPQAYREEAKAVQSKRNGTKRAAVVSEPSNFNGSELAPLISATNDTVSLSNQIMAQSDRQPEKIRSRLEQTLQDKIEMELTSEVENETYNKTSIVDPSTYKIARRLLGEGKELHIVARKLELPVSEIRLLDRLMRKEQDDTSKENETSESSDITVVERDQGFSMEHIAQEKLGQNDLDYAIEREIALL